MENKLVPKDVVEVAAWVEIKRNSGDINDIYYSYLDLFVSCGPCGPIPI